MGPEDTGTAGEAVAEQTSAVGDKTDAATPQVTSKNGKVLAMSQTTITRLRQEERARGRKLALEELNTQARAAGFKDFEAMKAAALRKPTQQAPQRTDARRDRGSPRDRRTSQDARGARPEQPSQRAGGSDRRGAERDEAAKANPRYTARLERENARLLEERKRLNRLRANAEKQRRLAQQALDRKEVEADLKVAAVQAGIQGKYVNFALSQLKEHVASKTPEDLKAFSEATFFASLREEMPFLYGVEERVVTGTPAEQGAPGAKPPPAPGALKKVEAEAGKVDAMSMTDEEFKKHLVKQGLTRPNGSFIA